MQVNDANLHPRTGLTVIAACTLFLFWSSAAHAGPKVPFTAHQGLELARDSAKVWAPDAELVYLENDEPLRSDGTAERWGYLFYSADADASRGYSLRDGKVLEATDLDFDFNAPPLSNSWLDSGVVLEVAEKEVGRAYCEAHQGQLSTMILIRGAFHEKDPDRSTWVVTYTSATEPALLVVVDAAKGEVVRTWKG